jgi:hypothetical protein
MTVTAPQPRDDAQADGQIAAPVPWAYQKAVTLPPATKRARKVVDSLPAWEPLPPGEIIVRRHRQE